jgi:hypothetical protein
MVISGVEKNDDYYGEKYRELLSGRNDSYTR